MNPVIDSLVLYKGQPAVVRQVADKKLTIALLDGQQVNVRPKDVDLLHPGPTPPLRQLPPPVGDVETAWELLDGRATTLAELAELAYGDYSPATAWAAWQLVENGVYFAGTPDAIKVHTPGQVEAILGARGAKAQEEQDWEAFVARIGEGRVALDDEKYITDVVALALGRAESSRTLRRLDRPQTPEAAHELLLIIGRWLPSDNPYPARLGVTTEPPLFDVGALPDEPRRDLTHLLALAIDDEGSSDPDDAISLDGERLWVHVADVAAIVAPDSPADVEARNRAANLYLPEGTIRMLPDELTDQLALGLQPISPALSIALAPRPDGNFELLEITPSWVRVTRTSYEAAEGQLGDGPLPELAAIAGHNQQRRIAGGAIELELPEVKIKATVDGRVTIRPLPNLRSRQIVREAMLMAGEAIGRYGTANDIPLAYTVQDPPYDDPLPEGIVPGSLPAMWAQRRLMQRSRQSTAPGRHSGLGLDVYVQVTSPLRRYLDLMAHQQIRAHLSGSPVLDSAAVTLRIGTADAIGRPVRAAERQANEHWTLVHLMQNMDWQGEGIVVENKPGRDVVLLPDLEWETELYHRPSRPLGSTLALAVDSVDLPKRTARFKVVD